MSVFTHKNTQHGSAKDLMTMFRKKQGFTGIMNPMMMVIITTKDLSPKDKDVLLYVIHQTIGWDKLETYFDIHKWKETLGKSYDGVRASLKHLEEKKVIARSKKRNDNKTKGILRIQPDYRQWLLQYDVDLVNDGKPLADKADEPINEETTGLDEETERLLADL